MKKKLVGVLRCPDPNEFCEQVEIEGNCRGSCFGNGVCIEKECKCYDGWTSYNCAELKEVIDWFCKLLWFENRFLILRDVLKIVWGPLLMGMSAFAAILISHAK